MTRAMTMGEPYLGEIRPFNGTEPPDGWSWCDGRQLPVAEYPELFAILGQRFGGDGDETFAVPALRGSAAPGGISDRAATLVRRRPGGSAAAVSPMTTSLAADGAHTRFIIAVRLDRVMTRQ